MVFVSGSGVEPSWYNQVGEVYLGIANVKFDSSLGEGVDTERC